MQFKKFQNMSEVAVGGGGVSKLQTKSEVLGFFFFNPSLRVAMDRKLQADQLL